MRASIHLLNGNPAFQFGDYVNTNHLCNIKETSTVDGPSRKLRAKQMGQHRVKKIWSNTTQLGEDGIDSITLIDSVSFAKCKEELTTQCDNDNNTASTTGTVATALELPRKSERVPTVQLEKMSTDVDVSSTQVSQRRKVEYAMDKIVDHDIVTGETLYLVRWLGYNAKDATAKPVVHLPTISLNPIAVA